MENSTMTAELLELAAEALVQVSGGEGSAINPNGNDRGGGIDPNG